MERENLRNALTRQLYDCDAVYNSGRRTREEIAALAAIFCNCLAGEMAGDRTAEALRQAFVMYMREERFFPQPARIIEYLHVARLRLVEARRPAPKAELPRRPGDGRRTPGMAGLVRAALGGDARARDIMRREIEAWDKGDADWLRQRESIISQYAESGESGAGPLFSQAPAPGKSRQEARP